MTPQPSIRAEHQQLDGRTVRDIVEYEPGQVDEPWCRRILRQVLQSLELQYAMRMPHRPITPDTIVFHDNGEPLLVPTPGADPDGDEADDLNALARVVHYAITQELAPAGPLRGRVAGYSDALVNTVDRCMADDPAERPRTVADVRDLLGIVPLGLPVSGPPDAMSAPTPISDPIPGPAPAVLSHPSAAAPVAATIPPPPLRGTPERVARRRGLGRWQRWTLAGGGAAILAALALVMFAEMRDASSFDRIVLTLPQTPESTAAAAPSVADTAVAPPVAATVPPDGTVAAGPVAPAASMPAAAAGGNAYKLLIQPWGVVYVDGVDRGVSPPVKRIMLAPGKHMVRIANPNFHDRVLEVDSADGGGSITVDFNDTPNAN